MATNFQNLKTPLLWCSSNGCCYTGSLHGYSICCSVCRLPSGIPPPVVAIREITVVTVLLCLQVIPWRSSTGCWFMGSLHGYSACCSVCRLPSGDPPPVVLHGNSPRLQCLLLCLQVIPWHSSTGCCYTGNHYGYSVCCSVCRLSPGVPPPVVALREVTMVTAPVLHSVWYRNLLLQLRWVISTLLRTFRLQPPCWTVTFRFVQFATCPLMLNVISLLT